MCFLNQIFKLFSKGNPSPPGSLWPLPNFWTKSVNLLVIASKDNFSYKTTVSDCAILNRALKRYSWEFLFRNLTVVPGNNLPILSTVEVEIAASSENLCETYPQLETDGEYEACNYLIFYYFSPKFYHCGSKKFQVLMIELDT